MTIFDLKVHLGHLNLKIENALKLVKYHVIKF
jgi:hypothetical protein